MALAIRTASPLRPDIALAQAISEFEQALYPDQKTSFNGIRQSALRSAPTSDDVMRMTADVNQRLLQKRSSGSALSRCFGTRFTNILQCVQRYAALGDVVVGGSQNIMACGIWALVRITIQVCIGFGTYLDKVSHFFMTAGRSAPRYESMAHIYRRSNRLGQYVSQYLLVIVQTCLHFIQFSQKSRLGQLAASVDDTKLRDAQLELDRWGSYIREEVNFLTTETVEAEATENGMFRALVGRAYTWEDQQRKGRQKVSLLEALSATDFETPYKQLRKYGTSTIFHGNAAYDTWTGSEIPASLMLLGKLGSGKSVTMASIVDHLYLSKPECSMAYFFCQHDNASGLTARAVVGSLGRQLVSMFFKDSLLDNIVDGAPIHLDMADVLRLTEEAVPPDKHLYFILDGIDECPEYEAIEIFKAFGTLQKRLDLSICVSYRSGAQESTDFMETWLDMETLVMPENNPDILRFIDDELQRRLESKQLVLGNEAIILEIREALLQGANGMFLWVALQIECLCKEESDLQIRMALQDLPPDLLTTFSRILRRGRQKLGRHASYQSTIFKLIVAAYRPLTVHEMREVISVEPGNVNWDPEQLANDIHRVLACCGCLVTVDEEDLSVRVIHQSVIQFLLNQMPGANSESKRQNEWHFTTDQAQRYMGERAITYLNYPLFETRVSSKVAQNIHVGQLPSHIIKETGFFGKTALFLLQSASRPEFNAKQALTEAASQARRRKGAVMMHFFDYASKQWLRHTSWIEKDSSFYDLWVQLLENPKFRDLSWFEGSASRDDMMVDSDTDSLWTLSERMMWAISHSHIPLYRYEIRGRNWCRAFSTIVPYLRRCMACNPRPRLSPKMCTMLFPLLALRNLSLIVAWLLSMGAEAHLDQTTRSFKHGNETNYSIIRAILLQDPTKYSRFGDWPVFDYAIDRKDVDMIQLLFYADDRIPFQKVFTSDLYDPAVVRLIYRLLKYRPRFTEIDIFTLRTSMKILHQTVNRRFFDSTAAMLHTLKLSKPGYEFGTYLSQLLDHYCLYGDLDLTFAVLQWIRNYARDYGWSELYLGGSQGLGSVLCALHSRSPERIHLAQEVWMTLHLGARDEILERILQRCAQLREWGLASAIFEDRTQVFGDTAARMIHTMRRYVLEAGLIHLCANTSDHRGLEFIKTYIRVDIGGVDEGRHYHCPLFASQTPLEVALSAECSDTANFDRFLVTVKLIAREESFAIHRAQHVLVTLTQLVVKLCRSDPTLFTRALPSEAADVFEDIIVNMLDMVVVEDSGSEHIATTEAAHHLFHAIIELCLSEAWRGAWRGGIEGDPFDKAAEESEMEFHLISIKSVLRLRVRPSQETRFLLEKELQNMDQVLLKIMYKYELVRFLTPAFD